MTQFELAADVLGRNLGMFQGTLNDFTDAEIFVRPAPGANHAAWQIGHLVSAETHMVSGFDPNAMPKLPEGFDKKFKKDTSSIDDPKFFGTKSELLGQLAKTRAATIAWVKTLKPVDLDKPAPEAMRSFCPTLGHVVALLPSHFAMHMGQMQVIRRKLGKPIIF
jgi:hypothetical protein